MKIIWTSKAKISFVRIIEFLNKLWTEKEIKKFSADTKKIISNIQNNPYMFIKSKSNKNIRKGLINNKVSLFYKVDKKTKEIKLLLFWDNRQNPKNLKY